MKLTGNLKKQVDNTPDFSEKRSLIEKAGMVLSDDELEMVAGGVDNENKQDDSYNTGSITLYTLNKPASA